MAERMQIVDKRGRTWTVSKVTYEEAEEEDFLFWYERLTVRPKTLTSCSIPPRRMHSGRWLHCETSLGALIWVTRSRT